MPSVSTYITADEHNQGSTMRKTTFNEALLLSVSIWLPTSISMMYQGFPWYFHPLTGVILLGASLFWCNLLGFGGITRRQLMAFAALNAFVLLAILLVLLL